MYKKGEKIEITRPYDEAEAYGAKVSEIVQKKLISTRSRFADGKYLPYIDGKCPHCGKYQSWSVEDALTHYPSKYGLQGLLFPIVLLPLFAILEAFPELPLSGNLIGDLIISSIILSVAGLLIGLVRVLLIKKNSSTTSIKNKPVIIWTKVAPEDPSLAE